MTANDWSRGTTLAEAMKGLRKLKAKGAVHLYMVVGDSEPSVDSYGTISYGGAGKENAQLITVGPIGTVVSVTKKLKEFGYSL